MAEFVPVIAFDSLKPGDIVPVQVGRYNLALHLVDGQAYCTDNICSHEESLISDGGFAEGYEVECPLHGARYDIRTGAVTMSPAEDPLRSFPVEVRDGQVYVQLP
jgi:nitrite reductase/ring-hydroxylating ferredoxin subunit